MKKILVITLFLVCTLISFGQKNIVETAMEAGNFKTLITALEVANLTDTLRTGGPFTVFAPTDDAFDRLPQKSIEALTENVSRLRSILLYHVVSGSYLSDALVMYPSLSTLQGQKLLIDTRGGIRIEGAWVTVRDIEASNGVIHVIDAVIFPREEPNLVQVARDSGIFDTFVSALEKAGLVDTLSGAGPFTVFAPTDLAFARIPPDTLNTLLNEPEWLNAVLLYHVVQNEYSFTDLLEERGLRTVHGELVSIKLIESGLGVNNTLITIGDIETGNGVVHAVDHVLMPKEWRGRLPSIVDQAAASGQFSMLLTALEAAGLKDVLSGEGLFTVFAPTDAVFAALGNEAVEELLKDPEKLKSILTYHVIGDEYLAAELRIAQTLFTLNGKPIRINVDGTLTINNVEIVTRDILARNGVIHVIDSLLIPR